MVAHRSGNASPLRSSKQRSAAPARHVGVCAAVVAFGLLVLATSEEPVAPELSYDGASYVQIAEQIARSHRLPELDQRPPLYPVLLAFFFTDTTDRTAALRRVVELQRVLWLLTGGLVGLIVLELGGGDLPAAAAGMLYLTTAETFSLTNLIYAEPTAIFACGVAVLAAAIGARRDGRAALWSWLAAFSATAAAYSRPIFQLLLPILAAFAILRASRRSEDGWWRRSLPFALLALLAFAPWYAANAVKHGTPYFVHGMGTSLTNYVGDRRLLGRFPERYRSLGDAYRDAFGSDPSKALVPWWEIRPAFSSDYEARTGSVLSAARLDGEMSRAAFAILAANPGYYVMRWSETWREFSTSSWPGVRGAWCPISVLAPAWHAFWRLCGVWAAAVASVAELFWIARRRVRVAHAMPIVTFLLVALAQTAIEPWPGQIRYRAGLEVLLLPGLALAIAEIARQTRGAPCAGQARPGAQRQSACCGGLVKYCGKAFHLSRK
jgi:hypothetical protein